MKLSAVLKYSINNHALLNYHVILYLKEQIMKRTTAGILNGIIASISYGTNPLFALPLYGHNIGYNSVLFYRYALALVIYGFWLKFIKKTSLKINFKEGIVLFFLGLFFSLSSLTLFAAFNYIASGIACTILFIYPVIVAFIMWLFFKEKISKTVIFSIALVITGVFMLYGGKSSALNIKGIILVISSAFLYALYIVGVKNIKIVKHLKSEKMSFYVMLFGLSVYVYNLDFCTKLQVLKSPYEWLLVLALAIIPTIVSLETICVSIKLVGSTTTAVLGALEPLTAVFFGVVLFNESLTIKIVLGILFVLSGVTLIVSRKL